MSQDEIRRRLKEVPPKELGELLMNKDFTALADKIKEPNR